MSWSENDIKKLASNGKIRGYKANTKKQKKYSTKSPKNIPAAKGKALTWLDLTLPAWSKKMNIEMVKEFRFDESRKWRFDFAWPAQKIAVEFEGGIYLQKSGHNTAKHYTKDTEKYNTATVLGWRVIRVTAINYKTVIELLNNMI